MAGDEIVAEFSGEVYSARLTTTDAVQRFSAASLRLKYVYITEMLAVSCYIGLYNADRTTFLASATILSASKTLPLHFVDLYNLGYARHASNGLLGVVGTY